MGDLDGSGSPFIITDGTGNDASGITLNFGGLASTSDGVIFRNSSGTEIVPVADYDGNVSSFELTLSGSMNSTLSGGTTMFTIEYDVRVK